MAEYKPISRAVCIDPIQYQKNRIQNTIVERSNVYWERVFQRCKKVTPPRLADEKYTCSFIENDKELTYHMLWLNTRTTLVLNLYKFTGESATS